MVSQCFPRWALSSRCEHHGAQDTGKQPGTFWFCLSSFSLCLQPPPGPGVSVLFLISFRASSLLCSVTGSWLPSLVPLNVSHLPFQVGQRFYPVLHSEWGPQVQCEGAGGGCWQPWAGGGLSPERRSSLALISSLQQGLQSSTQCLFLAQASSAHQEVVSSTVCEDRKLCECGHCQIPSVWDSPLWSNVLGVIYSHGQ